ncbi:MAG: fused N-dimethylarginine dimethylaminohydrolase/saccharopine dehydrogenase domain-containing protein, partial [Planctomycetes bacterium]|nr:fused N-dimethylarginine dimethylaminohydrolase/saccharopine dehydrogenase domain-containing protein [Planctomycetota bacterium]
MDYVINPWMAGHKEGLSLERARRQWDALRDAIAKFAEVVTMDAQPELPDMVFTANAGVVYGNKAIASHFMPHERRPEEQHFKTWFRENGFELLDLDDKIGFEGAGDCLHDRGGKWLWTGHGFRT